MKKISIFSAKIIHLLSMIPVYIILIVSTIYTVSAVNFNLTNGNEQDIPPAFFLIFICLGIILIMNLYFIRFIHISHQEIKHVGVFSSHDRASIEEGVHIHLVKEKRKTVNISTHAQYADSALSIPRAEDEPPLWIRTFRGRFGGGDKSCAKILKHFGVDAADIDRILHGPVGFKGDYELTEVSTYNNEFEQRVIDILMKVTV